MATHDDLAADNLPEDWEPPAAGTSRLALLAIRLAAQGKGGRLDMTRAATGELIIRFPLTSGAPGSVNAAPRRAIPSPSEP